MLNYGLAKSLHFVWKHDPTNTALLVHYLGHLGIELPPHYRPERLEFEVLRVLYHHELEEKLRAALKAEAKIEAQQAELGCSSHDLAKLKSKTAAQAAGLEALKAAQAEIDDAIERRIAARYDKGGG